MKDIVFKDIEISNIKEIPSETTRPAYLGGPDFRGLCVNIPYNDKCDERLNQIVTDIQNSTCNLSFSEEELEVIKDSEVLKKLLSELIIRFDTDPSFYTKKDYQVLVAVLSKTIPYLYNTSSLHHSELGNLDDVIKTIKEELGIIKSDIDNINVGVTSIKVETPSKYIKASPSIASEGDITVALDVTAVEASGNYSTPSKGLATDAYVDEKIASVSSFTAGDNIKIENGVISAEIPEGILTEDEIDDKLKQYQTKIDANLTTQDQTIVGAINELKSTLDITIPLLQAGL